jgi:hypothetical protein
MVNPEGMYQEKGSLEKYALSPEENKIISDFYLGLYKEGLKVGEIDRSLLEGRMEGEASFYARVLKEVDRAISENPEQNILVLFDIDDTLIGGGLNDEGEYDQITRPIARRVLQEIKKRGVLVGFLTARKNLESQLEDEFVDLSEFVDKDHLYSTREATLPFNKEMEIQEKYSNASLSLGDIEKLYFLENNNLKEDIIVPVDDLGYPKLLKYGVSLDKNEKFYI